MQPPSIAACAPHNGVRAASLAIDLGCRGYRQTLAVGLGQVCVAGKVHIAVPGDHEVTAADKSQELFMAHSSAMFMLLRC